VTFVEIVRYLTIDLSLRARQRTTPTFDTTTNITTDLENEECVLTDGSMVYSLPQFYLVHMADSCANEVTFRCDQVIV